MSLLIKALDKAQNAKAQEAKGAKNVPHEKTEVITNTDSTTDSISKRASKTQAEIINKSNANAGTNVGTNIELSLSPPNSTFSTNKAPVKEVKPNDSTSSNTTATPPSANATSVIQTSNLSATAPSAKNAANVFSAKGVESTRQNTSLALIAGAGLIALLGMGLYFYQFVDSTPDVFVPPRAPIEQTIAAAQEVESVERPQIDVPSEAADSAQAMQPADVQDSLTKQEAMIKKVAKRPDAMTQDASQKNIGVKKGFDEAIAPEETVIIADNTEDDLDSSASLKSTKKMRQSKNNASNNVTTASTIASDSASIIVRKSSPQPSINPILMSAYEAYNAGKDAEAQKLYKQVLQRDVRNIDALLGLGAIASRQGRMADASGWYGKVLELEPRNSIALTARLDSQSQGNEQGTETRLKNMLAKQPNDANLHVALGNLYAEQNQWPAAQQAYFDAYSLNKTADNAFNLAVSLDQMGKPKLALPYYQRALEQINASSNIDRAALEARIAAIQ